MPSSAVKIRTDCRSICRVIATRSCPSAPNEYKAGSSYPCRFFTQVLSAPHPSLKVLCTDEVDLGTNSNSLLLELTTLACSVGTVPTVSDNTVISHCSVGRKLQVNANRPTVTYLIIGFVQCERFLFNLSFIL